MEATIEPGTVTSRGRDIDPQSQKAPILPTWVQLGAGMAETTTTACFGFVRDVRRESSERAAATVDWMEGIQQGAFRVARSLQRGIDAISDDAVDRGERAVLTLVRALGHTGEEAGRMASRTVVHVVGRDDANGAS